MIFEETGNIESNDEWNILSLNDQAFLKDCYRYHVFFNRGLISQREFSVFIERQCSKGIFISMMPQKIMDEVERDIDKFNIYCQ